MGKTVLVVEDKPTNLKLVSDLLELLGCRVLQVKSAERAFSVIEEQDFSLVLMDIQLPGIDGIAAVRIIREEMGFTDMPIIAISAMAMNSDMEQAMEAGCCAYITKPIDTRKFLKMVKQCLDGEKPIRDREIHGTRDTG